MNPTRLKKDAGTNTVIKTSQKLLLTAGSIITLMGLSALASELWRTFWGLTPFSKVRVLFALGVVAIGLVLIQTLNPLKIVEVVEEFWISRKPGGRRWTDPPPPPPEEPPPQKLLRPGRDD